MRLICTLLLAAGTLSPQMIIIAKKKSAVSWPSFTYDLWQDFESCTSGAKPDATCLAASDHAATGSWDVYDDSNWTLVNASGEFTPSGDSGTRGLAVELGGTNPSAVTYILGTDQATVSLGFWYKTGNYASNSGGPVFLNLYSGTIGDAIGLLDERNTGSNARQIREQNASGGAAVVAVADDTWYWVTLKWASGTTGSLAVYNTSGTQVGTTQTWTCTTADINRFRLGNKDAFTRAGVSVYIDDFVLDWTDATFPLQ